MGKTFIKTKDREKRGDSMPRSLSRLDLRDVNHAGESLGDLVLEPVPGVVVFLGVADHESRVGFVVVGHAVVARIFDVISGLSVLAGCVADVAQTPEAVVSVASFPHLPEVELTEEEGPLALLPGDDVGQENSSDAHRVPRSGEWVGPGSF